MFNGGTLWVSPLLQATPYDPLKDFAPITLAASSPNLLVVHPSLPVKSVKELIALAKAKPGALNYASGVTGAPTQIAMEMFKNMASVNIVRISYKGVGSALIGLMSGQEQLMITTASSGAPLIQSGKTESAGGNQRAAVRVIPPACRPSRQQSRDMNHRFLSVCSPRLKRQPRLSIGSTRDGARAERPTTKDRLMGASLDISGGGPEDLRATMKSEISIIGKVIKEAGIHAD